MTNLTNRSPFYADITIAPDFSTFCHGLHDDTAINGGLMGYCPRPHPNWIAINKIEDGKSVIKISDNAVTKCRVKVTKDKTNKFKTVLWNL